MSSTHSSTSFPQLHTKIISPANASHKDTCANHIFARSEFFGLENRPLDVEAELFRPFAEFIARLTGDEEVCFQYTLSIAKGKWPSQGLVRASQTESSSTSNSKPPGWSFEVFETHGAGSIETDFGISLSKNEENNPFDLVSFRPCSHNSSILISTAICSYSRID